MCKLPTVIVRADEKSPSLAASDGLWDAEQGGAQGLYALLLENLSGTECRPSTGNLDTEAISGDPCLFKFRVIEAGVSEGSFGIVRLGREGLEQDAARDLFNVHLAHEHRHACVDRKPALALQLRCNLFEKLGVRFVPELDVYPELVARLVVELDLWCHRPDILGIHPVNIDIDLFT